MYGGFPYGGGFYGGMPIPVGGGTIFYRDGADSFSVRDSSLASFRTHPGGGNKKRKPSAKKAKFVAYTPPGTLTPAQREGYDAPKEPALAKRLKEAVRKPRAPVVPQVDDAPLEVSLDDLRLREYPRPRVFRVSARDSIRVTDREQVAELSLIGSRMRDERDLADLVELAASLLDR